MTEFSGWRKPTRSGNSGGNCVEVGATNTLVGIRDTKDREGGTLEVRKQDWTRFVAAL